MLKEVNMDLHIHTCLSPCAGTGMLPATLQELIHAHLTGNNDEQAFGEQIVVNEQGRETGREGRGITARRIRS